MSEEKNQPEPTMEEILASIRRIISDDNEPEKTPDIAASPIPAPEPVAIHEPPPIEASFAEPEDDILELTEIAPDDEPFSLQARPEPPPVFHRPEPEKDDRLVSTMTAAASTAAFASVAGIFTPRRNGELPIGNGALTLEDMVRDLVRPMLKEWLDENLPGIVERLVQEEIRRLARDAV